MSKAAFLHKAIMEERSFSISKLDFLLLFLSCFCLLACDQTVPVYEMTHLKKNEMP